jgi:hypothetical protein
METYSITGSLFGDDDVIIDVCLFEDLPFSDEYSVINQWRAGDIMDLILEEGLLKKEDRALSKVMSVRVSRYYTMDIEVFDDDSDGDLEPKASLKSIYTVGVSRFTSHISSGSNFEIKDMDQKIRDIKLNRIL